MPTLILKSTTRVGAKPMNGALPSSIFNPNRKPTLMFNGYAEEVAGLYSGMDLARYF